MHDSFCRQLADALEGRFALRLALGSDGGRIGSGLKSSTHDEVKTELGQVSCSSQKPPCVVVSQFPEVFSQGSLIVVF